MASTAKLKICCCCHLIFYTWYLVAGFIIFVLLAGCCSSVTGASGVSHSVCLQVLYNPRVYPKTHRRSKNTKIRISCTGQYLGMSRDGEGSAGKSSRNVAKYVAKLPGSQLYAADRYYWAVFATKSAFADYHAQRAKTITLHVCSAI